MTDSSRRLRVLLIGAGRRIQNNFLPALSCIPESFELRGIHSRSYEKLGPVAQHWRIPAIASLEDFDFSTVDVVVVSTPTEQNANVLRKLTPHASRLRLAIDTPIASSRDEYAEITPLLAAFRSVTVTEDYMNLPRFRLIREAVRTGLIGELRNITLYNIGYLHHGLALLRSFVGFGPAMNAWRRRLNADATVTGYQFEHGLAATVVGPYRRHSTGGIYLDGAKGVITEFPVDKELSPNGKPTYVLSGATDADGLAKFEIKGEGRSFSLDLPALKKMRRMNISDPSDISLERACGLIDVFMSLVDFRNINCGYGARDAFYDSFVSRRAAEGATPLDPFNTFGEKAPPFQIQRQSWTALSDTFLKSRPVGSGALASWEKIAVSAGDVVELEGAEARNGHLRTSHPWLNGKPTAGEYWFLFPPHWAPL